MLQTEMIGKVAMNYRHYTGADLYSDGAVEDELLTIVMNHHPSEFPSIIEQRPSWPVFYHLSALRGNIVDWIPIPRGAKILEVGSGCGAVTATLSQRGAQLTCVELSKKRSLINAYRNRDREGITIHVGNFKDIEPDLDRSFDYIFLIGVFEYGASYIGGEHPFETFLYLLQRHLAPGGRIVIAIENRLGMKYLAGCREDHAGRYFAGVEGYAPGDPARTFSKPALVRLMRNAGIQEYHFYYPYPDYKFTQMLHSDQYLPRPGEFADNVRNFDAERLLLFNEKYALESMIADRTYPEFANSFEVIIGPPIPVIYSKFSNDRAEEFQIRTDIVLDRLGRLQIHKHPMTYAARDHIRSMSDAYQALTDRYRGGDIAINDCQLDQTSDAAIFSFVTGVTLASLLDDCLAKGDMAAFNALFQEYVRRIAYKEDYPVADFDLIFSNILVNGPVWTVIDYEWTYGKRISTREIAFRALYCYVLEDKKREAIDVNRYYAALGLSAEQVEQLILGEASFQKYVTGGHLSLVEIWKLLGHEAHRPSRLTGDTRELTRIQIYMDRGTGFSEENSYFPEAHYDEHQSVTLEIPMEGGMKAVRLDPADTPCIVTLKRIEWNERPYNDDEKLLSLQPNGAWLSDDALVFHTADPNITFTPAATETVIGRSNRLRVELSCVPIPLELSENLFRYQVETPEAEAAEPEPEPEEQPEVQPFALQKPSESLPAFDAPPLKIIRAGEADASEEKKEEEKDTAEAKDAEEEKDAQETEEKEEREEDAPRETDRRERRVPEPQVFRSRTYAEEREERMRRAGEEETEEDERGGRRFHDVYEESRRRVRGEMPGSGRYEDERAPSRNKRYRGRYEDERDRYEDERDRYEDDRDRYEDERDRYEDDRDRYGEDRGKGRRRSRYEEEYEYGEAPRRRKPPVRRLYEEIGRDAEDEYDDDAYDEDDGDFEYDDDDSFDVFEDLDDDDFSDDEEYGLFGRIRKKRH
ncbi:MAG: class I SAM-dependent methyltransferase [Lachnospiraceae bacterium]|nr:class I SAM-dependent methyltransferase [Lachnospiraceae bacterium]